MKKIALVLIVCFLTSCTTKTNFGPCVGLDGDKNPNLTYKISYWNLFMGVLFVETIVVPIHVAAFETECPVGQK